MPCPSLFVFRWALAVHTLPVWRELGSVWPGNKAASKEVTIIKSDESWSCKLWGLNSEQDEGLWFPSQQGVVMSPGPQAGKSCPRWQNPGSKHYSIAAVWPRGSQRTSLNPSFFIYKIHSFITLTYSFHFIHLLTLLCWNMYWGMTECWCHGKCHCVSPGICYPGASPWEDIGEQVST